MNALLLFFQVNIPIVPNLPKFGDTDGNDTVVLNRINRSASNPPVSPHKINNFVYESSPNRLILDFGDSPADMVSIVAPSGFYCRVFDSFV